MNSWPHAPARRPFQPGAIMVTGGTKNKDHLLASPDHLAIVQQTMFDVLLKHDLELEAWAIFSNHYHFVASGGTELDLPKLIGELHRKSAILINQRDGVLGRRVWNRFWDTQISYPTSYFARLSYVHQNPVKHGLVTNAEDYEFCSMAWLNRRGERAWVDTVLSFKTDQVSVYDDF